MKYNAQKLSQLFLACIKKGLFYPLVHERASWFLFVPVIMGLGICTYFSMSHESTFLFLSLLIAGLLSLLVSAWFRRHIFLLLLGVSFFLFCLGFVLSWGRAQHGTPILPHPIVRSVVARVQSAEAMPNGDWRAVLNILEMERFSKTKTPRNIQVRMKQKNLTLPVGADITLLTKLFPPPWPVEPGGFDYARQLFFQDIGAVGFSLSRPKVTNTRQGHLSFFENIGRMRARIAERIENILPGTPGLVAVALITGQKKAIPERLVVALRRSGLAHILAISGLHMALFAGLVFWLTRFIFSLIPFIALRFPIKKWAAFAGLVSGFLYLCLSGFGIATQRSFLMLSLVFIAIFVEKVALSLRNVALVAFLLLLYRPESLLDVSFQMSFSAVVVLIAAYENETFRRLFSPPHLEDPERTRTWPQRFKGSGITVARYGLGLVFTSFLAGLATAPFAAFHFQRLTFYGIVANVIALPVMGFLIMPMALLTLILMPFSLASWPLVMMRYGINIVEKTALWISSWPHAVEAVKAGSSGALAFIVLGGLWLCLWRRRWRLWGVGFIFIGLCFWHTQSRPMLLVDQEGKTFGWLAPQTQVRDLLSTHPLFTTRAWLRMDGVLISPRHALMHEGKTCSTQFCRYVSPLQENVAQKTVVLWKSDDEPPPSACQGTMVFIDAYHILRRSWKKHCSGIVLDHLFLKKQGAVAFWVKNSKISVRTVSQERGVRPWVGRPYDSDRWYKSHHTYKGQARLKKSSKKSSKIDSKSAQPLQGGVFTK